jgi:GDP-L-fucose synthase
MSELYASKSFSEEEEIAEQVVLVTGGSGLIGKAIKEIKSQDDHGFKWVFLSSHDADLRREDQTTAVFQHYRPKFVIHLAARVGGLYRNMAEKVRMYEDNMAINSNVIRACDQFKVSKTVLCLSTCVFPDKPPLRPEGARYPFDETALHQGPPHPSNEGYAYAKRMMEVQARLYNEKNTCQADGPQFACVTPTNVYGPHDNFHLEDSHVIPGLIHRCYLAKRYDTEFVVRGTGSALRQFIHSRDLARRMVMVLFEVPPKAMPNGMIIAPFQEHSIREIVELIADATGLPREKIRYDDSYGDGQHKKTADNTLMRSQLNGDFTPLKEGITETVKWFSENYESARK